MASNNSFVFQIFLKLGARQTVSIHPSSVLFRSKPSCIVFTELVQTGKRYVRQVTLIDQDWLDDLPKETLSQLRQVIAFINILAAVFITL